MQSLEVKVNEGYRSQRLQSLGISVDQDDFAESFKGYQDRERRRRSKQWRSSVQHSETPLPSEVTVHYSNMVIIGLVMFSMLAAILALKLVYVHTKWG